MVTTSDALQVLGYPVGPMPGVGQAVVTDGLITHWPPELGPQPTQGQIDAVTESQVSAWYAELLRAAAIEALQDQRGPLYKLIRAVAVAAWHADNAGRGWEQSLKDATAAATSLADFKVRVAAISPRPPTTAQQLLNAIADALTAGEAD